MQARRLHSPPIGAKTADARAQAGEPLDCKRQSQTNDELAAAAAAAVAAAAAAAATAAVRRAARIF